MESEKEYKKELLAYIRANDKNYITKNLNNLTITALTIIKIEIEIKLHYKKKMTQEHFLSTASN